MSSRWATGLSMVILGLVAAQASSAAIDLLGRTSATFGWDPSSNVYIQFYDVYVACAPGIEPLVFDETPDMTVYASDREATVSGTYGESCQVEVVGRDAFGHRTPTSVRSEIIRFVAPGSPDGDFDGDGATDIAVQDPSDGSLHLFSGNGLASGAEFVFDDPIDANIDPSWSLVGTGHFDGDAIPDFLWKVDGAGITSFRVGGTDEADTTEVASLPQITLDRVVIGDFDGNGVDDFVVWSEGVGSLIGYYLQEAGPAVITSFPSVNGAHWKLVTSGDFNDDGTDDLLWQKRSSGRVTAWFFRGQQRVETGFSEKRIAIGDWVAAASGNFDNDPGDDILLHDNATGMNLIWYLANFKRPTVATPAMTPVGWEVVSSGDLDSDGRDDVVWLDPATNLVEVWHMDEYDQGGYTN